MRALAQGSAQIVDAIAALRAGEDVLLGTADEAAIERLEEGLTQAQRRGLIDAEDDAAAHGAGWTSLRRWLGRYDQPPLDVVGVRRPSGTRRRAGPTLAHPRPERRPAAAVEAGRRRTDRGRPVDARRPDTGRHVVDGAADAGIGAPPPARGRRGDPPAGGAEARPTSRASATGWRASTSSSSGRSAAHLQPAQAALAAAVLASGKPTVTVALRTPWDLLAYPSARTHVCSYGILPPSMEALAAALLGEAPFDGRLPVEIAGLHPRGHGLMAWG